MGVKIRIIKSPSGEGEAVWEGDLISFMPKTGKTEFIPLKKILPVKQIGGGTKMRVFVMRLRDGRSFECSMRKRDYGDFIKIVGVSSVGNHHPLGR